MNKKDKCVSCKKETQYDEFDHIDIRNFILKELDSYAQSATMRYMKKKKKTKDYDILPEEVEEEYIVWFW